MHFSTRKIYIPISDPRKNKEAGMPALNFLSQISPHSAIVELLSPPTHSHIRGSSVHIALKSHDDPLHLQAGCASVKIVMSVFCESNIHARDTKKTCNSCANPNEPTCCSMISSTVSSFLDVTRDSFSCPVFMTRSGKSSMVIFFFSLVRLKVWSLLQRKPIYGGKKRWCAALWVLSFLILCSFLRFSNCCEFGRFSPFCLRKEDIFHNNLTFLVSNIQKEKPYL